LALGEKELARAVHAIDAAIDCALSAGTAAPKATPKVWKRRVTCEDGQVLAA